VSRDTPSNVLSLAEQAMAAERMRLEQRRIALLRFRARWPFWAALGSALLLLAIAVCGGAA